LMRWAAEFERRKRIGWAKERNSGQISMNNFVFILFFNGLNFMGMV
jgi:hypothetical protein